MGKKILIIDDDQDFAGSLNEILKTEGYEIIYAQSGTEGFAMAKKEKADCILLDVMMEDSGAGLDTVKKLRDDSATKDIPVVLITGIRKPAFLLESFAPDEKFPNVKVTMEKPVKPGELISFLKKF